MNGMNIDEKLDDIIKKELIKIVKLQLFSDFVEVNIEPASRECNCSLENRLLIYIT